MWYLVNQIVLCLLVALVIGFVIAWILQAVRFARRLAALEYSWQSRSDSQVSALRATHQGLETAAVALEELKTASAETRQKLGFLETSLDRNHTAVQSLRQASDGVARRLDSLGTDFGGLLNRITELEAGLCEEGERTAALRAELGSLKHVLEAKEEEQIELVGAISGLPQLSTRIEKGETRLKELESHYRATSQKATEELDALKKHLAVLEPLAARLEEHDASLKHLQSDYQAKFQTMGMELSTVGGQLAGLQPLSAQIVDHGAKLTTLESEYESKLLQAHAEVSALRNRLAELESLPSQAEQSNARLEAIESRYQAALHQTAEQVAALEKHLSELELVSQRIAGNEARLRALESAQAEPKPEAAAEVGEPRVRVPKKRVQRVRARGRDDLKQIHGIGPVIERILHRQGIYLYRQIAEWGNEDVERVSRKLGAFQDRIRRDKWIRSARQLHRRKYGEGR